MDEICIANNIANSANGDTDIESYNYCWIWKDNANDNKFGTESSLLVCFFVCALFLLDN